jgi:hypothetical protein
MVLCIEKNKLYHKITQLWESIEVTVLATLPMLPIISLKTNESASMKMD